MRDRYGPFGVPDNRNWLSRNIRLIGIFSVAVLVVGLLVHGRIQDQRNQTALDVTETSTVEDSSRASNDSSDFASLARGIDPSLVDVADSDFVSLGRGICDQLDLTGDIAQTALGVSDLGTLVGIQLSDYQWGQMIGASIKSVCPEHSDLLPNPPTTEAPDEATDLAVDVLRCEFDAYSLQNLDGTWISSTNMEVSVDNNTNEHLSVEVRVKWSLGSSQKMYEKRIEIGPSKVKIYAESPKPPRGVSDTAVPDCEASYKIL